MSVSVSGVDGLVGLSTMGPSHSSVRMLSSESLRIGDGRCCGISGTACGASGAAAVLCSAMDDKRCWWCSRSSWKMGMVWSRSEPQHGCGPDLESGSQCWRRSRGSLSCLPRCLLCLLVCSCSCRLYGAKGGASLSGDFGFAGVSHRVNYSLTNGTRQDVIKAHPFGPVTLPTSLPVPGR